MTDDMIVLDEDVAEEPGLRPRELRSEEPFEERHDTNILTYMLDSSDEGKHEKAPETFVGLLRNPGGYAVTAQVVAVFLYVVKRELPEALGDALLLAERLRARGLSWARTLSRRLSKRLGTHLGGSGTRP